MAVYSIDWGVVGHRWAVEHLAKSLSYGRLRHAYLIQGVSGVGKSVLATGFAKAINCLSDTLRPCGECRACRLIQAGLHADVTIIRAEDRNLKIEQIRNLQNALALRPIEARHRIVIIENFNAATPQAQDALLKTLEEPPPYVVLILTVESAHDVLPTIQSRCQPIHLRPLSLSTVRDELERRGLDKERAALLAQLSNGRLGWALHAMDDEAALKNREAALNALEGLISADTPARFRYAEQVTSASAKEGAKGDMKANLAELLAYWQSYWRDVLLTISAARIGITNRDHRHPIEQLAAGLHLEDAQLTLQAIDRTLHYIDKNVGARLAMEVLMLDLPRHKLLNAPPGI